MSFFDANYIFFYSRNLAHTAFTGTYSYSTVQDVYYLIYYY